jgi:hypothetical protein
MWCFSDEFSCTSAHRKRHFGVTKLVRQALSVNKDIDDKNMRIPFVHSLGANAPAS